MKFRRVRESSAENQRLSVALLSSRLSAHLQLYLMDTHTRLTALFPGLPGWAGTRKVKPIWILLKQETVSGSGISWAICKSASRSRPITTPVPHHSSFFTGPMPFLPPNQQRQSTEGKSFTLWRCTEMKTYNETSQVWNVDDPLVTAGIFCPASAIKHRISYTPLDNTVNSQFWPYL